jgi:uncharacterized protein (DUF2132 family)
MTHFASNVVAGASTIDASFSLAMTPADEPKRRLTMTTTQPRNPLHGLTLEAMLNELVDHFGWPGLGQQIDIRCFTQDPSVASSLKFLRKTPWAREKVESLYLFMKREQARIDRASPHR